ncbi:methionyl-tRNA formyltransferase [Roseibacillus persicicus]|uniref:methionyl-tRNA formyltransferase n=1 Tax=Roseibacillus persicicus TaxID=454148 RepID=UPI00280C4B76|nr:methionyl-tRNA formyltransferase [Roseibacillus persicicus]MDQ8191670.1 methionyl-tRNA formyltransferase [Roseibacillus persicicus]
MNIVFLGTGEIAIPTFRALLESEHRVAALVTQPDKPVGRRSEPQPPAIKVVAQEAGIPVLQPERIKSPEALAELAALSAEVMVVMAYGQILPQKLIEMPSKAIINLHASLLPKYRGASCIQSAILNDDAETGWTVMHVVKALDAGDIIEARPMVIAKDETGESLHDRLAEAGPDSLLAALEEIASGSDRRTPQDEELTCYAPKLEREDGRLDWSRPAAEIERQIRAFHTWPGTFTTFVDGKRKEKRLKVFPQVQLSKESGQPGGIQVDSESHEVRVACGEGSLVLSEVQPEGAKRMAAQEFLRGNAVEKLG